MRVGWVGKFFYASSSKTQGRMRKILVTGKGTHKDGQDQFGPTRIE